MTNRHEYHQRTRKDSRSRGRFVSLTEYMLASAAWQALDGNSRALYVELARRYRGPNSNNGRIPFSVREAAAALPIGRSTAQRCFERLQELGFIKIGKRSGFSMKGRVATEWLLTEFPDDTTATTGIASKELHEMDAPKFISQSHRRHAQSHHRARGGSETGPCCISATFMALRWDCDAAVFSSTVPPQGHYSVYQVGMSCGAVG
jgi:DNA-binding transcriptional regulator YhcF (GntR family)